MSIFSVSFLTGKVTYYSYLFALGCFLLTVFPGNHFVSVHRDLSHSVLLLNSTSLCGLR